MKMATSLHQWESDPFFSAAEVVQDSADRMESNFRTLLHEQALVQETSPYATVHPSIEHIVRDLKTTLETTKWQLEDFERAVSIAAVNDSSGLRADIISRHEQFVRAIREQILDVEKYFGNPLVRKTNGGTDRFNLNEQENDSLALFLSGRNNVEIMPQSDSEDSILKRFLDPTSQSGFSISSNESVEHGPEETKNLSTDRLLPASHDSSLIQNNGLRKVASSLQLGQEARAYDKSYPSGYHRELGGWDLESSEDKSRSSKQRKLKSDHNRRNKFSISHSLSCANVNRIYRSLMKRWKDEEERPHSASCTSIFHGEQDCPGVRSSSLSGPSRVPLCERSISFCQWLCRSFYQRSLRYTLASGRSVQVLLVIMCTLFILAIVASQVA